MIYKGRLLPGRRGMTTLEYSVLVLALFLALFAMQTIIRRVISGKWKNAADGFGSGRQYEAGVSTVTRH